MFSCLLRFAPAIALLVLISPPLLARELANAPDAAIIGFSPDGRYFAYEQFDDDTLSDEVISAIDVIDRTTGRSVDGFPFGFLGVSQDGEFPKRVGGHDIAVEREPQGVTRLQALRTEVRRRAQPRLDALGVSDHGRRVAGLAMTDVGARPPVQFKISGTIPGAVPDQQPVYRMTADFAPRDQSRCVNDLKPADHLITLRVQSMRPGSTKALGTSDAKIAWPAGQNDCASAVRITDVIVPPGAPDSEGDYVAALVLAISWSTHAEAARYFAAFIKLPSE
jgi:hypothetical protein